MYKKYKIRHDKKVGEKQNDDDNKKNIIKATLFSAILLVLCTLTNVAFSANNGQELEDGIYTIKSALNEQYVLDIEASSQKRWRKSRTMEQWQY